MNKATFQERQVGYEIPINPLASAEQNAGFVQGNAVAFCAICRMIEYKFGKTSDEMQSVFLEVEKRANAALRQLSEMR